MNNLEELYAKRHVFEQYNQPVPPVLAQEIADAEAVLMTGVADTIISFLPEEVEMPISGRFVIGAEYINGVLKRVATSSAIELESSFESVRNVSVDDLTDNEECREGIDIGGNESSTDDLSSDSDDTPDSDSHGRKKSSSIGFTVHFGDGKEIRYKTARRTMIEALKYMGLERASKFHDEMFKGYPLVGREHRPSGKGTLWQKNVDGWWIYVNMSNARAVACIKGVANMLEIPVEIIMDESMPSFDKTQESDRTEVSVNSDTPKGRRTKYSLNDGEPAWKNRTVLNVVCELLTELPDATFEQVCEYFPKQLQGSYGVVCAVDEIERRSQFNRTEADRWFLNPSDVLTSADGIRFAVSTEWGDNFNEFRKHVIREFGWSIKEV